MDQVRLGSLTLQPRRQLIANGERVALGRRALDILSALAEAQGGIVTKDELLDAVWPGVFVEENALQVHIVSLRRALGPEAARLKTIRGIGYQLQVDHAEPAAGSIASPSGLAAPAEPRTGPCVVVLPFDNMSADSDQDYFADGITEDIITDLAQFSAVRVIARSSAFAFKGNPFDAIVVARQLDATHVVQGSVRRSAGRVRVSARLIDGRTNDHVWAARYDRELADIFDLQDGIARSIVRALEVNLVPSEQDEARTLNTSSAEAYDFYVRARALRATMKVENVRQAPDVYRRAVALDPDFALAWAGLASSLIQNLTLFSTPGIALQDIDGALARAVELAPRLPDVAASRAQRSLFALDWEGMEECIELFAARDKSWSIYSHMLLSLGRARQAVEHQIEVWRSDPLSPGANWGLQIHLDCAGRLDEADAEYLRSGQLSGMRGALDWEATKRMMALRRHDAVRHRFVAAFGDNTERFGHAPALCKVLDEPQAALAIVRAALDEPGQMPLRLDFIAHWAAYLGDDGLAVEAIRQAATHGLTVMGVWHPNLRRVRATPAFKDVLRRMGLVDHWRRTGNWGEFAIPSGESDFEVIA